MTDPFREQTEQSIVLNIPIEGRGSRVELEATVALDVSTKEEVEELLDEYQPRPLAHTNRIKKELADLLQQHTIVQVEEQ